MKKTYVVKAINTPWSKTIKLAKRSGANRLTIARKFAEEILKTTRYQRFTIIVFVPAKHKHRDFNGKLRSTTDVYFYFVRNGKLEND